MGHNKALWYLQKDWIVPAGILSKQSWFLGNDFDLKMKMPLITLLAFVLKSNRKLIWSISRSSESSIIYYVRTGYFLKIANNYETPDSHDGKNKTKKRLDRQTVQQPPTCYLLCRVTSKFITLTHCPQLLWKTRMNQINIEEALQSSSCLYSRWIQRQEKRG